MQRIRSHIIKLFTGFIASAILISFPSQSVIATVLSDGYYAPSERGLAPNPYNIGSPTLTELWVNPVTGRNSNNGLTSAAPLKTITAAWNKIPSAPLTTTGYRINLQPGTYPCEPAEPNDCQNNFGNRTGTYTFPIIIRASGGPGTVIIRGGLDILNVSYLYLIDMTLRGGTPLPTNSSGNNLLHLAGVNHVLLRGLTMDGPDCDNDSCNNLQEVLKVNQAQYLYVENSTIGGAWHSSVDYFVVQYGHFINNNVHTAGQWCMYLKGGTSYLRIEGNEYHNCQLGFSAGQSGNFAMMRSPWLHYDAYDIKFINNILHDLPGVGMSVAGGYNILFAYNTLYRVGISTENGYSLLDVVRAERGCNATDELQLPIPVCRTFIGLGGWGPNYLTDNRPAIPNRNVYIYNNIIYNPAPARTQYTHFNISEPLTRPSGFINMPNPMITDDNLRIRGNVIWNGDASMPLGIEGTRACTTINPTCNETQLRADNAINTIKPLLGNPAAGDFHPIGSWIPRVTTYIIPDFSWAVFSPSVPAGNTSNAVPTDFEGITRSTISPPGAFYRNAVPVVSSAPIMTAPANALLTNDSTPSFTWNAVTNGNRYQLEISRVTTFATKALTFVGAPGILTYTATSLPNGVYYWHVRAFNTNSIAGPWSAYRSFTVDITPPAPPVLSTPANAAPVFGTPPFAWLTTPTTTWYQFQYDNNADFLTPTYTYALTTLTHTPPAMAPGPYSWHVRARDAAGNWSSWSAPRTITILPLIPPVPVMTTPANTLLTNDATPNFAWNAVVSGNTYQLEISRVTTFATKVQTFAGAPRVLTYTAATLPNGVYYWHVRALNTKGVAGPWSAYRSFTVDITPPAPPILNSPANAASVFGTPSFTWLTTATAALYQFQSDNNADFLTPTYSSGPLTTLNHTPPAMTPALYSWHVRARDAAGNWSAWSAPRTITINPLAPPTLISPTNGSISPNPAPTLNWGIEENAVSYQVQVDNNDDFNSREFDDTAAATSRIPAPALTDGVYYWRVRQINLLGERSDWSTVWSVTIQRPIPSAPTLLLPIDSSATGTPTFSWESVENAVNYQIQVDDNDDFESREFDDTAATTSRTPGTALTNGVYHWRVRAINTYGTPGAWSETRTLTISVPPAAPALLLPTDAAADSTGTPTFTWNSVTNGATYQIQVDTDSDFNSPVSFDDTSATTSRTPGTALADGGYFWRVRAINIYDVSGAWSDTRTLTISIPPAIPALLLPTDASTDSTGTPTFSWESVENAANYQIQVDNNEDFESREFDDTAATTSRTPGTALANGIYHWRVRAINAYDTPGDWSPSRTVNINMP